MSGLRCLANLCARYRSWVIRYTDEIAFEFFMKHLARSLEAAPRRLLLIYYEPRHETAIQESGLFELLVARGEPGDPSGAWRIWRTLPAVERRLT